MKTELEKCLAGEPFNGGDKVLADMTLNAKRLLKRLNETDYADTEQRKRIFHDLFGKMGEHVHIDIDFHCEYGKHIFIGDQVIINMNCTFVDNNIIEIGDNVMYRYTQPPTLPNYKKESWRIGKQEKVFAKPMHSP